MAKSPTVACRPASIGFSAGVRLARNRPSGLLAIGQVLSAYKELIFALNTGPMNKQNAPENTPLA